LRTLGPAIDAAVRSAPSRCLPVHIFACDEDRSRECPRDADFGGTHWNSGAGVVMVTKSEARGHGADNDANAHSRCMGRTGRIVSAAAVEGVIRCLRSD